MRADGFELALEREQTVSVRLRTRAALGVLRIVIERGLPLPLPELTRLAFGAFDIIRALSAGHNDAPGTAERPFDVGRDGFVMGEGAALRFARTTTSTVSTTGLSERSRTAVRRPTR